MFWKITDEDLTAAQAGNGAATERVYAAALPACARLASTLTGNDAAATRVLGRLTTRSTTQLFQARDAEAAGRWFVHQTVLLTRTEPQPLDTPADTLMSGVGGPDVMSYRALLAGLRKLPRQQQEAVLLHQVHGWNPRLCAVAMDCSTQAVQTHLNEATRVLTPLAAGHLPALLAAMRQVHQAHVVTLATPPVALAARVVRRRWLRRLAAAAGWLLALAGVVAAAWLAWQFWGMVKI